MFYNSLKGRLFLSYSVFIGIIIGILAYSLVCFYQYNQLKDFQNSVFVLFNKQLQLYKFEKDFYTSEVVDTSFYAKGVSKNYENLLGVENQFTNQTSQLKHSKLASSFQINVLLDELDLHIHSYKSSFEKLVELHKVRGFKDYGIEGKLRTAIHKIEIDYTNFDKISLLSLRRIEKDYIIRHDNNYVTKMSELKSIILGKKYYTSIKQKELDGLLKKYFDSFDLLVEYNNKIGLFDSKGEKSVVEEKFKKITLSLELIEQKIESKIKEEYKNIEYKFFLVVGFTLFLAVIFAIYISDSIAVPVKELADIMEDSNQSHFKSYHTFKSKTSISEINDLQTKFEAMSDSIITHVTDIEIRNIELKNINQLLTDTNEKLNVKEKLLRKSDKLKETFLAIIAHDIRSPLTTLKGFITILIDHPEYISENERKDNLIKVRESTDLQINLLNNLLNWSRTQSVDFDYKPSKLNIFGLSFDTIRLLEPDAKNKSISIYNHIEFCEVYADKNMFELVLRNLISNAIKFSHQDGIIKLSSEIKEDFVEVNIIDNGVGIDKTDLEKLLSSEKQFTTEGTLKERGTGFGLLFCKSFIQKMGGKMVIESELGQGTKINFSIPLYKQDSMAHKIKFASPDLPINSSNSKKD